MTKDGGYEFNVDGTSVLVCKTPAGFFALENRCSHQDSPLHEGRVRGTFIFCPLHGVRFDLRTGAPSGTLTTTPVRTYPVTVENETIEIEFEAGDPPPLRRSLF